MLEQLRAKNIGSPSNQRAGQYDSKLDMMHTSPLQGVRRFGGKPQPVDVHYKPTTLGGLFAIQSRSLKEKE